MRTVPLCALASGLSLAGCTAGPDYVRPSAPTTNSYVAGAAPGRTVAVAKPGGEAQVFLPGEELPRGWWQWFGLPEIDALVAQAFAGNPTLEAARARLRGAEATLRSRRALRSPEIGGEAFANYGTGGGGQGGLGQQRGGGGGSGSGGGGAPADPTDPADPT